MTFRCPTVWSTELCASVPRTVLVLLIGTAKTSRLNSLPNPFRVAFFSTLQCIIYTESRDSDTPLSRSTTDHFFFPFFFFNATPWHRATLLSRSAIACVASVFVRFRSKERGTIDKPARKKNGASKRAGRGHPPVAQSDTALSDRDRCYLFFPWCHRVAQQRHSFSPRPKRYLVFSL